MLSEAENERLTRVGAGTPMGNVMRRYWLPALLSEELPEPDGAPVRVRLLGEDLVAFRDTSGNVGLVDAFCPHRRAPMFFGRNEECGLRCVYHGWKFDRNGTCVDMPSEPPDSLFKDEGPLTAYPTWEGGGMVWTYMGPPELQPPAPDYELVRAPETHRFVSKTFEDANWLQALEGGLDTSHSSFAHNMNVGDKTYLRNRDTAPRLEVERTDYGYRYAGIRSRGDSRVRARLSLHHAGAAVPRRRHARSRDRTQSAFRCCNGHIWVPIDDEHTMVYNWIYSYDPAIPITRDYMLEQVERHNGRGPDDLLPGLPQQAQPGQRLPDRPPAAEDADLHRHQRDQHPGLRACKKAWGRSATARTSISAPRTARSSRPASCCSKRRTRSRRGEPARRRPGQLPRRAARRSPHRQRR